MKRTKHIGDAALAKRYTRLQTLLHRSTYVLASDYDALAHELYKERAAHERQSWENRQRYEKLISSITELNSVVRNETDELRQTIAELEAEITRLRRVGEQAVTKPPQRKPAQQPAQQDRTALGLGGIREHRGGIRER